MSLQFVKVITVYPRQLAIHTESGVTNHVSDKERHLLEAHIEKAVFARDLPGYIDLNGQFKRVD